MEEKFNLEIPWSKFNEEEIHTIIAMLFHTLEYNIKDLHKADRANEGGADIIVEKAEDKIAFAVKLKPTTKDIYQLIEFSRRPEKRKVYVYVQTPTKKFCEAMISDGKYVEFWDVKKLNDFFVDSNLYFTANIIFENHKLSTELQLTEYCLLTLWKNCRNLKKEKIKPIDKKSFFLIWRLKDMAVTLHQANRLVKNVFETPVNFKSRELNQHFLRIFLNYLDYIERSVSYFMSYFLDFFNKNKDLVNNSVIERSGRSHWIWLASYKPLNHLEILQSELKDAIKNKKSWDELSTKLENKPKSEADIALETHYAELAKSNDVWQAIAKQIQDLAFFGSAIEAIIDDIVEEYFEDHVTLNNI